MSGKRTSGGSRTSGGNRTSRSNRIHVAAGLHVARDDARLLPRLPLVRAVLQRHQAVLQLLLLFPVRVCSANFTSTVVILHKSPRTFVHDSFSFGKTSFAGCNYSFSLSLFSLVRPSLWHGIVLRVPPFLDVLHLLTIQRLVHHDLHTAAQIIPHLPHHSIG